MGLDEGRASLQALHSLLTFPAAPGMAAPLSHITCLPKRPPPLPQGISMGRGPWWKGSCPPGATQPFPVPSPSGVSAVLELFTLMESGLKHSAGGTQAQGELEGVSRGQGQGSRAKHREGQQGLWQCGGGVDGLSSLISPE